MKINQDQTITSRTEFFYYAFRNILLVGLPLVFISALLLSFPHSSADTSSTDDITLSLDVACTVSSVVSSPHSASDMHVGQYKTDIGNTNISVFCNDNNGYNVYAVGNSNNTDGNTDLVSNLSDSYNIHTGTNTTGNSSWAMKLAAGAGSSNETTPPTIVNGYDSYSAIPNNYTLVAKRTSSTSMETNTSVSGSYFSTTYAIYAASTQPAGTYNGKVKYVTVHPSSNLNTAPDIDTAFAINGKMKVYEEGGNSYYAMQDMDSQICSFVSGTGASTATQLVDIRDNNLYWVAKLDDGKCWMTQNLDLELRGTSTAALTSENTDLSTTASGSGIYNAAGGYTQNDGIWTWTPSDSAVTSSHVIDGTSVPNWSNQNALPYSAEGGDVYYYTSNGAGDDTTFSSLQACKDANHTEADCKHYHRGNYYNWTAAVASNNSTNISTNFDQADNSICPKNWRLPVASNSDQSIFEFGDLLYTAYNITTAKQGTNITDQTYYTNDGFNNIRKSPLWFVRSGDISKTTLHGAASYGVYWSSTVASGSNAYSLDFYSSDVWPASSDNRSNGRSVRCLAR